MGLGNHIFKCTLDWKKLAGLYIITLAVSETESVFWLLYGNNDMATSQVRISSFIASIAACFLAYKYVNDDQIKIGNKMVHKILIQIGNCSFGLYLAHVCVMIVLSKIPVYRYFFFQLDQFLYLL